MNELAGIISNFSGANSWIALAGLALFVFLVLFKSVATDLVVNLKVPRSKASGIVNLFMILVATVALAALVLAFLDAKDERNAKIRAAERTAYEDAVAIRDANVQACTKSREEAEQFTMDFNVPGSVRCPGGGCFLESGSCNRREVWLSYASPGSYYIGDHAIVKGDMNDGNIGNLEVTARDPDGRAIAVRVLLWCDPADRPGAGGGWANASITGHLRLQNEAAKRAEIVSDCEGQYSQPAKPTWM